MQLTDVQRQMLRNAAQDYNNKAREKGDYYDKCGDLFSMLARIETASPDSNVEKNREMLLQRSIVGLAKYGVTTDNNPLSLREWLQHALEEALDMANYLQAAISKLDAERNEHGNNKGA
jgi:hypothetical protein